MKNHTHEHVMICKAIYHKHAERYSVNDYTEHRAKRMLVDTSLITKAIAKSGVR